MIGEEIEILKAYRDKLLNSASNKLDKDIKAFNAAIKALEQEPFMNKPCVAHQVCHEDKVKVLDNIRAEIMDTGAYEQEVNGKTEFLKGIDYCLGVIDKYKEESGGREENGNNSK
mgnify:CR=1 FL=1